MNLYDACIVLNLWHVVKARAQVWSISTSDHSMALSDIKDRAKTRFRELALQHHPDRGGDNNKYLEIQEAHELIKSATVSGFIDTLPIEASMGIKYYTPGDMECADCSKWSELIKVCATSSCTGFKHCKQEVSGNPHIRRKIYQGVQSNNFFSQE